LFSDRSILDALPGFAIPDPPNYRTEVDHALIKCDENKFAMVRGEFWSASNELVRMGIVSTADQLNFSEFNPVSAFATLQRIYCGKGYAGIGVLLTSENNSIKIAEIFANSPAEKAGVKVGDILTQVGHESIQGLTPEQVIEKVRGPTNAEVAITIVRPGQSAPIELSLTRADIHARPAQFGASR